MIVTLSLLKELFGFYFRFFFFFFNGGTVNIYFASNHVSPFSLGVYGDVIRVKIMFNKKENALIQMSDGTQAQLGEPII